MEHQIDLGFSPWGSRFREMNTPQKFGTIATIITLTILTLLPSLAFASDSAILRNGFSIAHNHRQTIGTITRLYIDSGQSNFVDIPTADIDHFESIPDAPAPPPHPVAIAPHPFDLNQTVKDASGTYRLDPDLVTSVIRAESDFNVRAISPKGAQGLMQLMPQTASQLGVHNAFDPQANVEAGTRYLRDPARALQLRPHQSPRRLQRRTAARRTIQRSPSLLRNQSLRRPHRSRLQQKETRRQIRRRASKKTLHPKTRLSPRQTKTNSKPCPELTRRTLCSPCPLWLKLLI